VLEHGAHALQPLVRDAHPQHGVDAMAAQFSGTSPHPGVVDVGATDDVSD